MYYTLSVLLVLLAATSAKNCSSPLGIEDGRIKDSQFSASSETEYHIASLARLNRFVSENDTKTWCAENNDITPWIKVTLNGTHRITAVAIQGRNSSYAGWFVKKFKVGYIDPDTKEHKMFRDVFEGPKSKNEISKISLEFVTSEVRILPVHGEHYPKDKLVCLRMELYGCPEIKKRDFCKENNPCQHKCVNENNGTRCMCDQGHRLNSNGHTCDDIDECVEGHSCDTNTTTCFNENGGYHCLCHKGLEKMNLNEKTCTDINECLRKPCQQICQNEYKSYKCKCDTGFRLNKDNVTCADINECTEGTDTCDRNTTQCVNNRGGYTCKCNSGLKYQNSNKKSCKDIDECSQQYKGGCDDFCHNTHGSYYCSCRNGTYLYTDKKLCMDVDECKDKSTNDCEQVCQNQYGKYKCGCYPGYTTNSDGKTCKDVNECDYNQCSDNCTNTVGSFLCSCKPGFILAQDQRTCIDFNECVHQTDNCDSGTSTCINTHGSFECRCKSGFKNSFGKCVAKSCPPLQPIPNGYLSPLDCTKKDAKTFRDVCVYKCMPGYQLNEKSINLTSCNEDGNWDYHGAGLQPLCQPIRCPQIQAQTNMEVVPQECANQGGEYNKECHAYCASGYELVGRNTIKCRDNGQYDGTFNSTRCVKKQPLVCPKDVKIVLPLGAEDTVLPLEKLSVKLDVNSLTSSPAGALTGQHRFKPRTQSHQITLMKNNGMDSCVFHVQIIDKEAPKVKTCPPSNVYVSLNQPTDIVTWPEPTFQDNVGIMKTFNNIKNNVTRPEQVYYVYYAARDASGNEATCRFFVHVKARYCKKDSIPGGNGANMFWIGASGNSLSVFLSCTPPKILSTNITGASIFKCENGKWQSDVPDCVEATAKTTANCPDGHFTVLLPFSNVAQCAKCPKGTMSLAGKCIPCVPGFYQDVTGSERCKKCPSGTTSVVTGGKVASICQAQCPPGSYSMTGLYDTRGCERCPEGSYQDLYGQQSCKVCPAGGVSFQGSVSETECRLPARVSRIFPEGGSVTAKVGDTLIIDCYGTGSPRPFMSIKNTTQLAPANYRGITKIQPLTTGNKHISGLRMMITGTTTYDHGVYLCIADNKQGDLGGVDQRELSVSVQ